MTIIMKHSAKAAIAVAILYATVVLSFQLEAATFLVTKTTDDDGPCEIDDCALREAVLAANAAPGRDTIVLPGGTYQLSIEGPAENLSRTGDLDVRDDLEILGSEISPTVVVGDGTDRVLQAISTSLAISYLTISGGVSFSSGGGIRSSVGNLTILKSTIRGNSTHQDGGGISFSIGNLTVIDSAVHGNTAGEDGFGGGIETFGIISNPANVVVINTTISGNAAFSGGGIYADNDSIAFIANSTIADNTATFRAEAFANDSSRPTFANTLFVGDCAILSNPPISLGGNIESPGNSCQLPDSDRYDVPDAGIGPLRPNGGPTWTHALLPGSPAIDTAVDGECPDTDQRGLDRPFDGDEDGVATCDVGAYELREIEQASVEVPALSAMAAALFALWLATGGLLAVRRNQRSNLRPR